MLHKQEILAHRQKLFLENLYECMAFQMFKRVYVCVSVSVSIRTILFSLKRLHSWMYECICFCKCMSLRVCMCVWFLLNLTSRTFWFIFHYSLFTFNLSFISFSFHFNILPKYLFTFFSHLYFVASIYYPTCNMWFLFLRATCKFLTAKMF